MVFKKATKHDLPEIIAMYADDKLGKTRENYKLPLAKEYIKAFNKIITDTNQELIIVLNENNEVVGTLQLTFLQYLNRLGSLRLQIESVRVKKDYRGNGIGKKMFEWSIKRAKEKNAKIVQLTTDKKRPKAIKFYESLGFKSSHEGMKLQF